MHSSGVLSASWASGPAGVLTVVIMVGTRLRDFMQLLIIALASIPSSSLWLEAWQVVFL